MVLCQKSRPQNLSPQKPSRKSPHPSTTQHAEARSLIDAPAPKPAPEAKASSMVGGPVFIPRRPLSRWAQSLIADSELASQNVA